MDNTATLQDWIPYKNRSRRTRKVTRARKHTNRPRPEIPIRRPNLRYDTDRSRRWYHGGVETLIAHALSPMFPAGERFFIKSVMAFKDKVEDPELRAEMRQFSAQEAVHTHEHQEYDSAVAKHYDVKRMEQDAQEVLDELWDRLKNTKTRWFNGPRIALALTVSLEHFTALLGHQVLSQPDFLDGVDEEFATLWSWHAAEEIEHKAVAYDVYEAVGGNWLERSIVQLIATQGIVTRMFMSIADCLEKDGLRNDPKAWANILYFLMVKPGIFSKAIPDYLDFFRPGFHPWDHDDRELLEGWKKNYPQIEATRVDKKAADGAA